MQLHIVRGGTREDVLAKKYNIAIGISIGNKWFTPENVRDAVVWALHHTKSRVCIYVADSIHGINVSVRKRLPIEKATALAIRQGDELLKKIRVALESLSLDDLSRVDYCKWNDIETEAHLSARKYLFSLYQLNTAFHSAITGLVHDYVSKEKRTFSTVDIDTFGTYIIEELPELMNMIRLKGTIYGAYIYPYDTPLTQFVEKLQDGTVFPAVAETILHKKKLFLEVR
jgi:tRNA-dependent cyclodipeptide synthase